MNIKKNIRNELFNRTEMSAVVEAEKNPSFDEMRKEIAKEFSSSEDKIDVYNVKGKFGRNSFLVKANIYDSEDDLKKSMRKTKKQRREEAKAIEEAKKAEAEAKKSG